MNYEPPLPSPQPLTSTVLLFVPAILITHVSGILQYSSFGVRLILLSMTSSRFTMLEPMTGVPFKDWIMFHGKDTPCFIYLFIHRQTQMGRLHILPIVSDAAMNMGM